MKSSAIALLLIISAAQAGAGEKPNFVFFLSDDQLKADYGCYGLSVDLTPTVDRLAREGMVLFRKGLHVISRCRCGSLTGRG